MPALGRQEPARNAGAYSWCVQCALFQGCLQCFSATAADCATNALGTLCTSAPYALQELYARYALCLGVESVRLDIWLDVACLFKTRSEATKACRLNKVILNGQAAKAHREVCVGDELVIHRPLSRKQLVTVLGIADRHISKAEARLLYEDTTPKPSPEEIEIRRLERIYRAAATPPTRPDRDLHR